MSSDGAAPVAYLVLAHRRPRLAADLAHRVCALSPDARVLVHWDAGSREDPPAGLPDRAALAARRVVGGWGRWSLVEATLVLLREARERWHPRWSVLVSGEDWPVRRLDAWEAWLDATGADAVLTSRPVADRWAGRPAGGVPLAEDEVRRYRDAWHHVAAPAWPPAARAAAAGVRRLERLGGRLRRGPAAMDFYGRGYAVTLRPGPALPAGWTTFRGEQWATLGARATAAVLDADPRVAAHFRRTLIPDEAYVHTVVHADPALVVRQGHTSFAPWHAIDRLPRLALTVDDVPEILASGAPFARKADGGAPLRAALDGLVAREAAVGQDRVENRR